MPTNYPGGLDTAAQLPTNVADNTPQVTVHAGFHDTLAGAAVALETKLGTGASVPASGRWLHATGAGSSSWDVPQPVSHGGSILNPVAATSVIVWRVPPELANCTVVRVVALRVGGTGATINASHNALNLLSSDLSLTTTSWTTAGGLQNTTLVAGDDLTITVVTVAGAPAQVAIQVDVQG